MTVNDIVAMLEDDLVSHGFLSQCLDEAGDNSDYKQCIEPFLNQLLTTQPVEIGAAKLARPDHVEFIAWSGSAADRISRAMAAVESAAPLDKEFAYWLCLRKNVDRFE